MNITELPRQWPTVTIVIPCRNEEKFIGLCLESIRKVDYPTEFLEVIVVDNGSSDRSAAIAAAAGVKVLFKPGALVGGVRNHGAAHGTGQVLAFLDGDCIVGKEWLRAAVVLLADETIGIVGGDCLSNPHGTWVEKAWAPQEPGVQRMVATLPGASLLMRRQVFQDIDGFDETLSAGEDDNLCVRLRAHDYKIVKAPDCAAVHLGYPRDLRSVFRRQVWHGSFQLDVTEGIWDKQLFLTHAFLLGGLLVPQLIWLQAWPWRPLSLALLSAPMVALAITKSSGRRHVVHVFLSMIVVALWFYSGRAVGLLRNYGRLFFQRKKKALQ